MSDWERPDPARAPGDLPAFEVPLSGDDAGDPSDGGEERPPTNWRKVAGLSSLAGVALGIVASVVILTGGGDDDEDTAPTTTLDPDELSASITVPPTLPPFSTTPVDDEPTATTSQTRALFDPEDVAASVATLPPLPGDPNDIVGYQLSDGTMSGLDADVPRRSVTEYAVGLDGFEQVVTITNDDLGRYLLEFDYGRDQQGVIVDLPGGRTYAQIEDSRWTVLDNDDIAQASDVPDMATFVRNLQLGPLRSDTRDEWVSVTPGPLVAGDDGETWREHVVVLAADAVPEWARYVLGPDGEAAPFPDGAAVGFAAYLNEGGALRRVTGSAEFGSTEQRIVHTIEVLDEAPAIDLPDPELVDVPGGANAADLGPEYPDAEVPDDGRSRELAPALDALAAEPPRAATFSVADAAFTTPVFLTVQDLDQGAVQTIDFEDSTEPLVDLATGEAVERPFGDGPWTVVLVPVEPLLPDPIVPAADLTALAAAGPVGGDRFVTVDDETLRWFELALPPEQIDLPPALDDAPGAITTATVRVFVGGNDLVSELHVLLEGPDPRVIVQKFVNPRFAPPVDRTPLDDLFG